VDEFDPAVELSLGPDDVGLVEVSVSDAEESSSSGQLLGSGIPSSRFAT